MLLYRNSSNTTYESIPYTLCKNTNFVNGNSNERIKEAINDQFYWPTYLNYTIKGNVYADVYSFIDVSIKRCSGSGCKSKAEIDRMIDGLFF